MVRISFVFIFISFSNLFSQKFIGLSQSNFSGAIGIQQNPASFQNGKFKWDVNLAGLGSNFYTESFYFANESWLSLSGKSSSIHASDSIPSNFNPNTNSLFYLSKPDGDYTGLLTNTTIYGPLSFAFNIQKWSFGLFNTHRVHVSTLHVPKTLNYYDLKVIKDSQNYNIYNFNINAMAWSEIGLHVGHRIEIGDEERFLSIGGNLKYLLGYEAAFLLNNTNFDFTRYGDSIQSFYSSTEFGFSSGRSTSSNIYEFGVKGEGLGIDIGLEYLVPMENADEDNRPNNYIFKIGGSIMDIGAITFSENAQVHRFNVNGNTKIYKDFFKNQKEIDNLLRATSGAVYGDTLQSISSNEFSIMLPTSLNIMADYQLYKNVYINGFLSRRLIFSSNQLAASNLIALTPRYESRWLEFGLPISFVEDKLIGLGAYLRLGFLTIGTEHLSSILFKQTQLNQADLYLAFKFNPFRIKKKEENATSFGQGGRKGETGCYKW